MRQFKTPRKLLGALDADLAAKVISASADVALIVDRKGVIRDLAFGDDELLGEGCADWVGVPWIETVTPSSRSKVEELIRDANSKAPSRWRHINHASTRGGDLPVRYSAIQLSEEGRIVAIGRDLRATAALQQRLMEAQRSMEREYARLRQVETQYRTLFQLSGEAVIIVDDATLKITEANPRASQLLQDGNRKLVARSLLDLFAESSAATVQGLIAAARAAPRAEDIAARLASKDREVVLSASLFRQDNVSYILIRVLPEPGKNDGARSSSKRSTTVAEIVNQLPDAFAMVDTDRRIVTVNAAFLELAQLATEEQVKGQPLDRWLGRVDVDVDVLIANLREHGSVRRFLTMVRGEFGSTSDVEVSAVSVTSGDYPCYGITLRSIERIEPKQSRATRTLPRSVEQMTELVGRVPLKDLVRETTDIIERLCIEAALELTGDNRASAAEILGLSRQSLYVKLRRYGLGDLDDEAGS